jgi:hypothetical protein
MKLRILKTIAVLFIAGISSNVFAIQTEQIGDGTVDVDLTVGASILRLKIAADSPTNMEFGTITLLNNDGGVLIMGANNIDGFGAPATAATDGVTAAAAGAGVGLILDGAAESLGEVNFYAMNAGDTDLDVVIDCPESIVISKFGGPAVGKIGDMTVDGFTFNVDETSLATDAADGTVLQQIFIGARLNIVPDQDIGAYSGTATISFTYL